MPQNDHSGGALEVSPKSNFRYSPSRYGYSPNMRPPMSVIVIRDPPAGSKISSVGTFFRPSTLGALPTSVTPTNQGPTPAAFRLKPRHPVKSLTSHSPARTRKRRAASMSESTASSAPAHDSFDEDESQTETRLLERALEEVAPSISLFGHFEGNESQGQMNTALATLKGLSLQSPHTRKDSNGSSPFRSGSHHSTIVSSFSKFSASPPTSLHDRPAGSPMIYESPPRRIMVQSSASSKSSPKFAPLTIVSYREGVMIPASQRTASSHRPPLHLGAANTLFSLDATSKESDDEGPLDTPKGLSPQVLCPNSTSSASTMSTMHDAANVAQSSKQARTVNFDSPGIRSFASLSPRTPLPKISLTPRSSISQGSNFPRFPSPPEEVAYARTPRSLFTLRTSTATDDECAHNEAEKTTYEKPLNPSSLAFSTDSGGLAGLPSRPSSFAVASPSTKSFLPMPDWSETARIANVKANAHNSDRKPFAETRTQSLSSRGALQSMLDEDERHAAADVETGSLSGSDDDEPFLLAAPGTIIEEKLQASSRRNRRRRSHICGERSELPSSSRPPTMPATATSSASLMGMNFVFSNSNIDRSNMEMKLPDSTGAGTMRPSESYGSFGSLKRDDSMLSFGLAFEDEGSSSRNFENRGRDLITPPVMMDAQSPPPLSPRGAVGNRVEHRLEDAQTSKESTGLTNLAYTGMLLYCQHASPSKDNAAC